MPTFLKGGIAMNKLAFQLFVLSLIAVAAALYIFVRKLLLEELSDEANAVSESLRAAEAEHKEAVRIARRDAEIAAAVGGIKNRKIVRKEPEKIRVEEGEKLETPEEKQSEAEADGAEAEAVCCELVEVSGTEAEER